MVYFNQVTILSSNNVFYCGFPRYLLEFFPIRIDRMLGFLCKYTCIFCQALSQRKLDLCQACEQDLAILENYCSRCAEPLAAGQPICGACLGKVASALEIKITALFAYQFSIKQLITNLKFRNNLIGAKILGELLGNHLSEKYKNIAKPEVIIPVPLHAARLRERGYNQALEISRSIATKLKLPIDKSSIKRIKNTAPQAKLTAKERRQNIKRAFSVASSFRYHYVALVDDVITTGNTLTELSKVLSTAGVKKLDIWCCAKSLAPSR